MNKKKGKKGDFYLPHIGKRKGKKEGVEISIKSLDQKIFPLRRCQNRFLLCPQFLKGNSLLFKSFSFEHFYGGSRSGQPWTPRCIYWGDDLRANIDLTSISPLPQGREENHFSFFPFLGCGEGGGTLPGSCSN